MLFFIAPIFTLILLAFGLLFRNLARRTRSAACDTGTSDPLAWLDDFSTDDYRPMERLLDRGDYIFLASQPGFEPFIARRLRRQRTAIFHAYLRGMVRDFHRLLAVARFITVYARQDSAAFEADLWRIRISFYCSLIAIETGLALNTIGLGAVDTSGLLKSMERMQVYTQSLMPAIEPVS